MKVSLKNVVAIVVGALESERDSVFISSTMRTEGAKLWDILTALRGPDNANDSVKEATTGIIRAAIGLKHNKNAGGAIVASKDTPEFVEVRKAMIPSQVSWHFFTHAKNAFAVLGLKWDEVNEDLGKGGVSGKEGE